MALASLALGKNGSAHWGTVTAKLGSEAVAASLGEQGEYRLMTFGRELKIAPAVALTVSLKG
jgi:hypothetical protein